MSWVSVSSFYWRTLKWKRSSSRSRLECCCKRVLKVFTIDHILGMRLRLFKKRRLQIYKLPFHSLAVLACMLAVQKWNIEELLIHFDIKILKWCFSAIHRLHVLPSVLRSMWRFRQNTVGHQPIAPSFLWSFIVSVCLHFLLQVVYWDAYDGSAIRELEGSQSGAINGMHVSHDGRHFVTGKWPLARWCAPLQSFVNQGRCNNHSEWVKKDF